jgi:hypothetical protein
LFAQPFSIHENCAFVHDTPKKAIVPTVRQQLIQA